MNTKIRGTQSSSRAGASKSALGSHRVAAAKTRATSATTRAGSAPAPDNAGFSAVLKDVLDGVPAAARDGFVRSVCGDPSDGLDRALWGKAPTAAGRQRVGLENLRHQYEARAAVVNASMTRTEAAGLLGVSEQAVLDRLEAGDLIGLKKGREWRLPAWQFDADSERGFLPGLARLREVFPGGVVSLTEWATTPNTELSDATPAQELAVGQVAEVARVARDITAAAW